jgi:hypothetical protein
MDSKKFESVTKKNSKSELVSDFDWWGLFLWDTASGEGSSLKSGGLRQAG